MNEYYDLGTYSRPITTTSQEAQLWFDRGLRWATTITMKSPFAASRVYRDDLGLSNTPSRASQHPENVWNLHGYVECLHRQHKHAEATAMEARLDLAKARADEVSTHPALLA